MFTIGQLKKKLEEYPDDTEIVLVDAHYSMGRLSSVEITTQPKKGYYTQ